MDELFHRPLRQLSEAIQQREIKSADLVGYYLDRISRINPQLNAVVNTIDELAIKRARKADAQAEKGEYQGVLHGIPMTIKDSLDTTDAVTTWGTLGRKEFRAGGRRNLCRSTSRPGRHLVGKDEYP